jgi:deoxycytidine triphosphate deaminase
VPDAVSVLSGEEVAKSCSSYKKVNPNGVDLAPKEVKLVPRGYKIYLHGEERGYVAPSLTRGRQSEKPEVKDVKELVSPDEEGFYDYVKGNLYELRFAKVTIPADCTGFAFPRSTVNRLGIIKLESAVFDSGYSGEPTQTIFTPIVARVHKDEASSSSSSSGTRPPRRASTTAGTRTRLPASAPARPPAASASPPPGSTCTGP